MSYPNFIKRENYKKLASTFIFSDNIHNVFNIVKDVTLFKSFITSKEKIFNYHMSTLSNCYEEGSEFLISLDKDTYIKLTIRNLVETDYSCQISWEATTNVEGKHFFCEFNFYAEEEYKTLFAAIYYIPKEMEKDSDFIFCSEERMRMEHYRLINLYLLRKQYLKTQTEVYKMKGDTDYLINMITNINVVSRMCGELVYTSSPKIINGAKISLKIKGKNDDNLHIKVKEVRQEKKGLTCEAAVFTKDKKIDSYLTLELISNDNKENLVILTNKYFTRLNKDQLKEVSALKLNFLSKLKKNPRKA